MPTTAPRHKYRDAIQILQRGRDVLVEALAEEILEQADELIEGGFAFNEFLEGQGTRLHFLGLLVAQLEQSAEALDEAQAAPPSPSPATAPKKRRSRSKKLQPQAPAEGPADDA